MATIQIKNVPDLIHTELRRRAATSGRSLQEFLLAHLVETASRPTVDEVLDRASGRAGGSLTLREATRSIRSDRDRR